MKPAVAAAIDELRLQFPEVAITAADDNAGGAYFIIEQVDLGPKFVPSTSWLGGHILEAYPYADIYPLFIDGNLRRADGQPFNAPVTSGHNWQNRPAIQVSRANRNVQTPPQSAKSKVLKVMHFLENLP